MKWCLFRVFIQSLAAMDGVALQDILMGSRMSG